MVSFSVLVLVGAGMGIAGFCVGGWKPIGRGLKRLGAAIIGVAREANQPSYLRYYRETNHVGEETTHQRTERPKE